MYLHLSHPINDGDVSESVSWRVLKMISMLGRGSRCRRSASSVASQPNSKMHKTLGKDDEGRTKVKARRQWMWKSLVCTRAVDVKGTRS